MAVFICYGSVYMLWQSLYVMAVFICYGRVNML